MLVLSSWQDYYLATGHRRSASIHW